jgi:ATP synthase F1 gamma subunit
MRRAIAIRDDLIQTRTIEDLTDVFENIASMHIAKIHDRVVASKVFFADLWDTYQELRVNPKDHFTHQRQLIGGHKVLLAITTEGKLSGGIDEMIIDGMLANYTDPAHTQVMVIGSNGVALLQRRGIKIAHTFSMPEHDSNFSVSNIIEAMDGAGEIAVFYQTYESLRVQKVVSIELNSAVRELSEDVKEHKKVVSSRDYIFEPSIDKIAEYMESVMFGVALIQVVMETKLAQYANRFNNMSRAKQKASDLAKDFRLQYYHAKRAENDERLKEMIRAVRTLNGGMG